MVERLTTAVLVVGGGAGGTAAAIQSARRGVPTILVSEFGWLGGMLTSAGVSAPDGNELDALQTGIWGDFLRSLRQRQPEGLDHGWVSCFTYEPQVGAAIFADWVAALPNLRWIVGQVPQSVTRSGHRITGVRFADYDIDAEITIDGTELGDLLALGDIPHRWGWELDREFGEPSAPDRYYPLTETYPVQVPTWVVLLKDDGENQTAPLIPAPPNYDPDRYAQAWANHGGENCLNYGRLPNQQFMLNWPIHGNDYGEGVERLRGSEADRHAFHQEAIWQSLGFAHYIQQTLGDRYGLALHSFPWTAEQQARYALPPELLTAFALHPYYRESRRLVGLTTVREQDLLPISQGSRVAALPMTISAAGCDAVEACCEAIAVGNYVLDHHYPSGDIKLSPKSMQWGGRWTGTPFTIPYRALVPKAIDGFLACEKNIAVTHMANGATRLQPLVLNIGQAVGMAAALCIEQQCDPRQLVVRSLQNALIADSIAPSAVIPLLNQPLDHPQWHHWQTYYLDHPESYPASGSAPIGPATPGMDKIYPAIDAKTLQGVFHRITEQKYELHDEMGVWQLITLSAEIDDRLSVYPNAQEISLLGQRNLAGKWIRIEQIRAIDGGSSAVLAG
jgi:hypothetical protein